MKNSKVLIPETLKQKYLKQIHQGHQGIEACRSRAREFVFWININNDLKELVEKCDLCQSQQNSTAIVQKYVSEVPPHPWHTLGSDLFYFQRIDFLVVVDYFSKYLIIRKIPNSTSSAVIKELGMIFSEFGKPQIFRSDNGPCYSSQEFRIFMQNWQIEHRTSSPHYPQSNGLAESMVKVSKNLIEKAVRQDLPWNQLLLDYRCTPISSEIPSPAEILFGRKLQSSISNSTITGHEWQDQQEERTHSKERKASSTLIPKISKIELKHCHSRQDRMYGSRTLILGSVKKLWYVRSAENPTPTWLRFQQLDSASGETATSSSQGKATRIQFLQIPSWLQDYQRFHKNPQCSSSQQFQVAKLPVQWMPFPQYPLRCRMEILPQELLGNPEYHGEVPKEFHPQGLDYRSDISCIDILRV